MSNADGTPARAPAGGVPLVEANVLTSVLERMATMILAALKSNL
jgi:hypothetical protein